MTATAASTGQPSASPASSRMIDPRGHRFGATLSVVILLAGFVLGAPIAVAFLAFALGASALLGTRYSILGRPWPLVRKLFRIAPPRELEHELPLRFAQALGFIGFALATVLFVLGLTTLGWVVAAAVGALQAILAATGYCLGCRMYFLKWWVPAQFKKLARRTTLA
jgi:MFS family permease